MRHKEKRESAEGRSQGKSGGEENAGPVITARAKQVISKKKGPFYRSKKTSAKRRLEVAGKKRTIRGKSTSPHSEQQRQTREKSIKERDVRRHVAIRPGMTREKGGDAAEKEIKKVGQLVVRKKCHRNTSEPSTGTVRASAINFWLWG